MEVPDMLAADLAARHIQLRTHVTFLLQFTVCTVIETLSSGRVQQSTGSVLKAGTILTKSLAPHGCLKFKHK